MVPISIIKTPTMFKMILIVSVPASLVRTSSGYGPHFRQHLRLLKHGLRRLLLFVGRISFPASAETNTPWDCYEGRRQDMHQMMGRRSR